MQYRLFNRNEYLILESMCNNELDYLSQFNDLETKREIKELKELLKKIKMNSEVK